jgi:hypothetical protein
MATATQRAEDVDVTKGADEVSLPQKMLSAVSGSILTSLLGMYFDTTLPPNGATPMKCWFNRVSACVACWMGY